MGDAALLISELRQHVPVHAAGMLIDAERTRECRPQNPRSVPIDSDWQHTADLTLTSVGAERGFEPHL